MNFLTSSEQIEKIFEKYFQKGISLNVRGEQLKKGKFLLIKNCIVSNNYYYEFTIERTKKIDVIRIPYPFNLEEYETENLIYMDYRLSSLFKNNVDTQKEITEWIKKTDIKNPNKLFDSILEIKFE